MNAPAHLSPNPRWDAFLTGQPRAHVLQLSDWGRLKSAFGWSAQLVTLEAHGQITAGAQVLFRPLPYRLGTMAYLAMGAADAPPALWQAIHRTARARRAAFLKWEPGLFQPNELQPNPLALGFRASPQTVQPPRTIVINITGTEDSILARMNQGTRRKIRQSQKNDVRYWQAAPSDVPRFTALMQTTSERNAFGVHEAAYYQQAYDLFVPSGRAALLLAEHEGDSLAGVLVFALGQQAWYLYGASSNVKRNLMASYGVQWAAIQWARAQGCTTYDLWGIPDADEATLEAEFERRSDGLWGVYGFKRGWGGQVIRSLGAWDYAYNPLLYRLYTLYLQRRGTA